MAAWTVCSGGVLAAPGKLLLWLPILTESHISTRWGKQLSTAVMSGSYDTSDTAVLQFFEVQSRTARAFDGLIHTH